MVSDFDERAGSGPFSRPEVGDFSVIFGDFEISRSYVQNLLNNFLYGQNCALNPNIESDFSKLWHAVSSHNGHV